MPTIFSMRLMTRALRLAGAPIVATNEAAARAEDASARAPALRGLGMRGAREPCVPAHGQRFELLRAHGRAEIMPLRLVAIHGLEQLHRRLVLHALGAGAHFELVREVDQAF